MRRALLPLLATATLTATLTAGLAVTASPATAAGETCQGRPATVVGVPGTYQVSGTSGNDVIVSNGASYVEAGAGDDLICLTGYASVDAGEGDDTVVAGPEGSAVELGTGSDTFLGSAGLDSVSGGIGFYRSDTERDVIDTGPAGSSQDTVWSGKADVPNSDEVRLGWGRLSWAGAPTSEAVVDGGTDSLLDYGTKAIGQLTIDNGAATLKQHGHPTLAIPGFTSFLVRQPKGLDGFIFRGSARDELLSTSLDKRPAGSRIDMRGGDDELNVSYYGDRESQKSSYEGGSGRDLVRLFAYSVDDVDLDLRRGLMWTGKGRQEVRTVADSFEDAQVKARDIEVVGTNSANDIELHGCTLRVTALGGNDDVSTFKQGPDQGPIICKQRTMHVDGGRGNDTMEGTNGRDRLIGGPGRDTAVGLEGRDTCQAEVRKNCEVRR